MKDPKVPIIAVLIMFVITASAGMLMRSIAWVDISPIGFHDLRNAHSHIGFLGWIFPIVMLLLERIHRTEILTTGLDKWNFWGVIAINVLMFLSFLKYGYGPPSIVLLSIHTILAVVYGVRFWNRLDKVSRSQDSLLSKLSMLTMMISFLGPLAIPIVKNTGLGPTEMKMAIHFYLHFQYNGFFVLAMLAMLAKGIGRLNFTGVYLLVAGIAGTYFLTVQWGLPSMLVNVGVASALIQVVGGFIVIHKVIPNLKEIAGSSVETLALRIATTSLFLKLVLQALLPFIPQLVLESGNHFWVIAFLHLIFLGAISPTIVVSMIGEQFLQNKGMVRGALVALVAGFVITELTLVWQGGLAVFSALPIIPFAEILAFGSALLLLSSIGLLFSARTNSIT